MRLSMRQVRRFRETVYRYYRAHGRRDLPWRNTRDPYRIFISEMMLQQTQVKRVTGIYGMFIERFPGFARLAGARFASVLGAWSGLGYNRRARYVHETARIVVSDHGGVLPADIDALVRLPGVGAATASAIAAFAFGKAHPFVETNIRTVYIHFFFPQMDRVADADVMTLVEQTLDRDDPRTWYHALMDYGVMLKKRFDNPSRRSARYSLQAPFEGSVRQARGLVIRALTAEDMTRRQLLRETGLDGERLASAARQLEREGMIVRARGRYRIP